ncbi:hypothetical protein DFS34DRAFT_649728 [Phlyctochytrium arcticum]|nr:hypothetical protein DFS34DRAFT_649728 [Phlyctochytrium arcticum]
MSAESSQSFANANADTYPPSLPSNDEVMALRWNPPSAWKFPGTGREYAGNSLQPLPSPVYEYASITIPTGTHTSQNQSLSNAQSHNHQEQVCNGEVFALKQESDDEDQQFGPADRLSSPPPSHTQPNRHLNPNGHNLSHQPVNRLRVTEGEAGSYGLNVSEAPPVAPSNLRLESERPRSDNWEKSPSSTSQTVDVMCEGLGSANGQELPKMVAPSAEEPPPSPRPQEDVSPSKRGKRSVRTQNKKTIAGNPIPVRTSARMQAKKGIMPFYYQSEDEDVDVVSFEDYYYEACPMGALAVPTHQSSGDQADPSVISQEHVCSEPENYAQSPASELASRNKGKEILGRSASLIQDDTTAHLDPSTFDADLISLQEEGEVGQEDMLAIKEQALLLKKRVYELEVVNVDIEIEMLKNGTHPEFRARLAKHQGAREHSLTVAQNRLRHTILHLHAQYQGSVKLAKDTFLDRQASLRGKMLESVGERKQAIIAERTREIRLNNLACSPTPNASKRKRSRDCDGDSNDYGQDAHQSHHKRLCTWEEDDQSDDDFVGEFISETISAMDGDDLWASDLLLAMAQSTHLPIFDIEREIALQLEEEQHLEEILSRPLDARTPTQKN